MKTTRAYVINIRKIVFYMIITLVILSSLFALSIRVNKEMIISYAIKRSLNPEVLKNNFPVLYRRNNVYTPVTFIKFLSFVLNENLEEPTKIFADKISFVKSVRGVLKERYNFADESNNYYIPKVIEGLIKDNGEENTGYNPATEKTIPSVVKNGNYLEKAGITLDNKTTYNPDINKLYNEKLNLSLEKDKPQVLIVHTHGSESYNPYDRSQDLKNNIIAVGREMKRVFEENGINVIHSEKMHDVPKFNNSYKNSLATVNEIISKYPSIKVVLDIHRDAMITEAGEVYKVVADAEGKKVAQVMFVVGTNQGGLKHDRWKENLKFAVHCQKRLNEIAPNVARPINLRQERFNQHTTDASVIIEIGTNGNTLGESVDSGRITAEAIADVLNKYR